MKRILIVALFAACGGTSPSGTTNNCSITLSGAMTGTYTCQSLAGFDSSSNQGRVTVTGIAATGGAPTASINIEWTVVGDNTAGSVVTNATTGSAGGVLIIGVGSVSGQWETVNAGSMSDPPQGTWTATLTGIGTAQIGIGPKAESVTGTFDATCPARPGANTTGTVNVHATF